MAAQYDNDDGRLRGRGLQARRLKKWVQARGLCAKCGKLTEYADPRRNPRGFHLDHIIAIVNKGEDTEDQTQVLCLPCHDIKTARDMGHRPIVKVDADGWPTT